MRITDLSAAAGSVLLMLGLLACNSGRTPTSPSEPGFPQAVPDATVLVNLPLVLELERAERQDTLLVRMLGSAIELDGTPRPGSRWVYMFNRFVGQIEERYLWTVWWDGRITFRGPEQPLGRDSFDHLPDLVRLDSDALAQLALEHGGDRFLEEFPDGYIRMSFYVLAGIATCEMKFFNPGGSNFCEPEVYIDAGTGDLLLTAGFECLDRE